MTRWIASLRPVRKLGKPRVENGIVFCNYCDDDEATSAVNYPGGHSVPACTNCARAILDKGDRVTEILPSIFLSRQGRNKIVVALAEPGKPWP